VICTICAGCTRSDDADKIRALIAKGAASAEAHDIGDILDLATRDVRAMPMDLNRQGIKGVLWRTFQHYGPLKVLYPHPPVELKTGADEGSATFPFLIVKKEQAIPGLDRLRDDPLAWLEAIGENADLYRIRLELTKLDGNWRVHRANLEHFTGIGFDE
jgi:hypothetical protein